MVQSYKSGRAFRDGLGFKVCLNISGLHTKLYYNIKSNDFFYSWRRIVVLSAVTSVSEVIVIFLQLHSVCKHSCVLVLSAGLVSHCF